MPPKPRPKISLTIIFVAILCIILYLANLVIYKAVASIFSLTVTSHLFILGIILGVLSVGFILSTLLGMKYYTRATRIASTITSVWMGLFVYLFLASVIYGIVVMIVPYTPYTFGMIIFACAILASLYGILHARKMYIIEQKVTLNKLPASWHHKKIVFISDLHLGQIHGHKYAAKIAEKINKIKPEIVCIGGDLFDGTSAPDLSRMIQPLKELVSTHGTYFIPGNHEEFGDNSKFIQAVKSVGINVLQDQMVEIDGVQILGVDYATTSEKTGFTEVLSRISFTQDAVSILLKHEPKNIEVARDAGISLQLSGHTHRAQLWPLGYIARLVYGKYSYGLQKMGDMQIFTSSGVGTWGPPMRVGTNCEIVVLELVNPTLS